MLPGKDNKNYLLSVDAEDSGKRIDVFLSGKMPLKSRTSLQKIISSGKVALNDAPVKNKNAIVHEGDIIRVGKYYLDEKAPVISALPCTIKLDIKYEDEYLMIISKPAGMTVHPAPGNYENTLAQVILNYFKKQGNTFYDEIRAGIAHRLDKDTSGLIVVAKSGEMLYRISGLFKSRQIKKTYLLLAAGRFAEKEGIIRLPLGRSRVDRKKISVSADRGRESETTFKVIEQYNDCALLNAFPLTGRTHQVRVHFSYIGHPLVGDKKYGNKLSEDIACRTGLKRHFLHAVRLEFDHPVTGMKLDIIDIIASDLERTVEKLKSEKNTANQ